MADYLETYLTWYPNSKIEHYPQDFHTTLSSDDRSQYYQALELDQQQQLELHRKYELRSKFTTFDYLKDTQWQFDEYRVDYNYPKSEPGLRCKCGKKLKYQFVLISKNKQKKMYLGMQHFSDHLGVSPKVANEIKKGLSQVDFGIDEILWLHHQKYQFPNELWRRYCFAHYRNSLMKQPVKLNRQLLKRLASFRQVDLPIYTVDFQLVLREIALVNKQLRVEGNQLKQIYQREHFEAFAQDLAQDILTFDFNYDSKRIFSAQGKKYLKNQSFTREQLMSELIERLRQLDGFEDISQKRTIFHTQTLHLPLAMFDENCLAYALEKYLQYGFRLNFFISLPRSLRMAMQKALKAQKAIPTVQSYAQELQVHLNQIPKGYQKMVLESLLRDLAARE